MYENELELFDRIQLGEDSGFELKLEIHKRDRDNLADELAAFANGNGGELVIGVGDDKKIQGLEDVDKTEKLVIEICNDTIEPLLLFKTFKRSINEKAILIIEIPKSTVVHSTKNGFFLRLGSSKRKMSSDELQRLFKQRSQTGAKCFDEQQVLGTDNQSLDKDLTLRFITKDFEDEDERIDLLKKRNLLVEDMRK